MVTGTTSREEIIHLLKQEQYKLFRGWDMITMHPSTDTYVFYNVGDRHIEEEYGPPVPDDVLSDYQTIKNTIILLQRKIEEEK